MPIFIICVLGVSLPFAIDSEKGGSLGNCFRLLAILSMFQSDSLAFRVKKASGSDQNVGKIANSQKLAPREPPFLMPELSGEPRLLCCLFLLFVQR